MRSDRSSIGLLLVTAGFAIFAWTLFGFRVTNASLFALASAAALFAAVALWARRTAWAALGPAVIGCVFLWLQLTRPSFALSLGTAGNLLVAAGTWTAAYGLLRSGERLALRGWLVAAVGGLAFLPGNLEAGATFLVAGLLATLGFLVAAAGLVSPAGTDREAVPE